MYSILFEIYQIKNTPILKSTNHKWDCLYFNPKIKRTVIHINGKKYLISIVIPRSSAAVGTNRSINF